MNKYILLLFGFVSSILSLKANPVDSTRAHRAAVVIFNASAGIKVDATRAKLTYRLLGEDPTTTALYVFSFSQPSGFVVLSGDDQALPLLGYSTQKSFGNPPLAPNLAKWLEGYRKEINYIVANNIAATPDIQRIWQGLDLGRYEFAAGKTNSVSPLLTTEWNQSPYYNALCPYDYQDNDRTVVGCVATAMAQIMRYHNWPTTGQGFHSYTPPNGSYGTLSANFGSTTYNWANMPNSIYSPNSAVATLSYHCGVSVDMQYGVAARGGSSVPSLNPVATALKNYFKYHSGTQYVQRQTYSNTAWLNLLKAELDNSRPILYAGMAFVNGQSSGGHAFVFDGYDNSSFFHVNWGWGGLYNGYFTVDALNPSGQGTGGGAGQYNSNQQAVVGIKPNYSLPTSADIRLSTSLLVSPNPNNFATSVNVQFNIGNYGSTTFNGKAGAAIFDANGAFIEFIDSSAAISLGQNQQYASAPNYSKVLNATPGNYQIAVLYKANGGNWSLAKNNSYTNPIQFTISPFQADLELTTSITPSVSQITNGQSFSVTWNVVNNGASSFNGAFSTYLINNQGSIIATVQSISTGANPLPSGYTYQNPIQFSTAGLNVNPGTYYLAAAYTVSGSNYYIGGTTAFVNPVQIIVKNPPLSPDAYETNNTSSTPYILPVVFNNNIASVTTNGANLHLSSDLDYYGFQLPSGYDYTITHSMNDVGNQGGGSYTADVLYTYRTTGMTSTSTPIDDIPSGPILLPNGGSVLFGVSPYFAGLTGTYKLNVTITRTAQTTATEQTLGQNEICLFPNPASGTVVLRLPESIEGELDVTLLDVLGKTILSRSIEARQGQSKLDIHGVTSGTYLVKVSTGVKAFSSRLVVVN